MKNGMIFTMALSLLGNNIFFPASNTSLKPYNNDRITLVASTNKIITPNILSITDILELEAEINNQIDYLKGTSHTDENGQVIVKNTEDILVLVNKERNLPSDYEPKDLVVPNVNFSFTEDIDKRYLRKEAAFALEELFKAGKQENIILYAVSGYRSYATQKVLFNNKVQNVGAKEANRVVARPGQSEHQTGLGMDVSCNEVGISLEESFGQTVEGKWLKANAYKYGFIIRYQKETTGITGYIYEPWHIRYVGKEVAEAIYKQNITLEEFLGAI